MSTPGRRELDLVLFGATGFVGRLTAGYLAEHAPDGLRIGLAGRSGERLEGVRRGLGRRAAGWPLLVADATDETAVTDLARRTRLVATTVGPYRRFGTALVAACAREGSDYCDLTGEILFARDSIDANHDAAVRSHARIVHSCGFDSIPSDLGVLVTARRAAADDEGTLGETTLYVRSMRGWFSGGTIDSLRQQALELSASPAARERARDSYALSPARGDEPPSRNRPATPPGPLDQALARLPVGRAPETGRFTAPFFMASYNTRVVRRSNALTGWSYGRDFRYREVTDTGAGPVGAATALAWSLGLGALAGGMMLGPTRAVLDRVLPAPGEGPSEEVMRTGRFVMDIRTTTTSGAHYRTRFAAEMDPGYSGTAVMLGESALALALDDDLPDAAGVLTPATGIGMPLVDRLRARGFTIETHRR